MFLSGLIWEALLAANEPAEVKIKRDFNTLSNLAEEIHTKTGAYPPDQEGSLSSVWRVHRGGQPEPKDAFDNQPYLYQLRGKDGYRIVSTGPDSKINTSDDVIFDSKSSAKLSANEAVRNQEMKWRAWIVRGAIVVVILSAVLSALYTKYYPAKHNKYYPNGQIFEKTTLINGVKNGPAVTYYANGALRSEDNYKNGLLDGEIKRYLENGKYFSVNMFKNGLMEGLTVLYYPSGTVKARQMFKNNILDGLTQFYYEDGNIKEENRIGSRCSKRNA